MRTSDELIASSLAVITKAWKWSDRTNYFSTLLPLFSGGYDSLCACYVASQHPKFEGKVHHIDTGIGSKATRAYVESTCKELGWKLVVYKSKNTYEEFVKNLGFPGPGGHQWVYIRLKERCIEQMTKGSRYYLLATGCRSEESVRRMGNVVPIRFGDVSKKTGQAKNVNRVWVNPCHDWTAEEQRAFVNEMGFPRNPVKDSILGMSGECFCGAFARPSELEMIEQVCPDVYQEILRLEKLAKECEIEERNQRWGHRGKDREPLEVVETGPLCSSCDRKARAAGVVFKEVSCSEE